MRITYYGSSTMRKEITPEKLAVAVLKLDSKQVVYRNSLTNVDTDEPLEHVFEMRKGTSSKIVQIDNELYERIGSPTLNDVVEGHQLLFLGKYISPTAKDLEF